MNNLVYTHTSDELNSIITEIMNDYKKLVEKAKSHGLDIKYAPNATSTLELYFNDDYPDLILVDKYFSCQLVGGGRPVPEYYAPVGSCDHDERENDMYYIGDSKGENS